MTTDWPFYSTSWEAADAPPPPPYLDLSLLFWSLPDSSLASDGWRQVLVLYNPPAARLKGYPADEILGQHFSRFYPPEDLAAGKCEIS
jgi:hypothetical protein